MNSFVSLQCVALAVTLATHGAFAAAQTPASASHAAKNPVYESLIRPAAGDPIRLQPPRFPDDQSAARQRMELDRIGGDRYSADALLRPSVLAPHVLDMDRQPAEQQDAIAQRVRVVFALRGNLDTFTQESFLDSLLEGGDSGDPAAGNAADADQESPVRESRALTAAELQAAGVETQGPAENDGQLGQEHYRLIHGELFSRIRFSGVVRSYASRTDRSVLLAMRLDERFAQQPGLGTTWQRLQRDEAGELRVAEAGDFLGGGAYLKVTRWQEDPEMLVFEAELMLLEPQAWFGGSNLLGSKLPPAIQSQVRKIRRAALRALP